MMSMMVGYHGGWACLMDRLTHLATDSIGSLPLLPDYLILYLTESLKVDWDGEFVLGLKGFYRQAYP